MGFSAALPLTVCSLRQESTKRCLRNPVDPEDATSFENQSMPDASVHIPPAFIVPNTTTH